MGIHDHRCHFEHTFPSLSIEDSLHIVFQIFGLPLTRSINRPAAVYALAAGCLLHVFGSVADIIGAKEIWVVGSFLFVIFTVAVGFAATSLQIIMFRTCLGVAIAMCLPTTVSLIVNTFPKGSWRNTAFAMNGMAQPLGYALGLVLGGVFTDTIGWRWSYYIMAMINFCISVVSMWSLPSVHHASTKTCSERLWEDVDWVVSIFQVHQYNITSASCDIGGL
jgi:MFS family permease